MGRFHAYPNGPFSSRISPGKQPIKKRPIKRFLRAEQERGDLSEERGDLSEEEEEVAYRETGELIYSFRGRNSHQVCFSIPNFEFGVTLTAVIHGQIAWVFCVLQPCLGQQGSTLCESAPPQKKPTYPHENLFSNYFRGLTGKLGKSRCMGFFPRKDHRIIFGSGKSHRCPSCEKGLFPDRGSYLNEFM